MSLQKIRLSTQADGEISSASVPGFFGNAADGADVILSSSTTLAAGASFPQYGNLTIDNGVTLSSLGRVLAIRCTGVLTVNGIISMTAKGNAASPNGTDAKMFVGGRDVSEFCTQRAVAGYQGGIGLAGGGAGGYNGMYQGGPNGGKVETALKSYLDSCTSDFLFGGIIEGGAGGQCSQFGYSGRGGGCILISAYGGIVIGATGSIVSNGQAGVSSSSVPYGGGGGGGGGFIFMVAPSLSNSGVVASNGGAGGNSHFGPGGYPGGTNATVNGTPTNGQDGQTSIFNNAGSSGAGGAGGYILWRTS